MPETYTISPLPTLIYGRFETAGPDGYSLKRGPRLRRWRCPGCGCYQIYRHALAANEEYAAAATGTKDFDSKAIAKWLRADNPVDTVIGTIVMGAKGDIKDAKYVWYRFSNGPYTEGPSGQYTATSLIEARVTSATRVFYCEMFRFWR